MSDIRKNAINEAWSDMGAWLDDSAPSKSEIAEAITKYEAHLWQPIETAPKSSKFIMAWAPERKMAFQICWQQYEHDDGSLSEGWKIIGEYGSRPTSIKFTHWQELPKGPEGIKP